MKRLLLPGLLVVLALGLAAASAAELQVLRLQLMGEIRAGQALTVRVLVGNQGQGPVEGVVCQLLLQGEKWGEPLTLRRVVTGGSQVWLEGRLTPNVEQVPALQEAARAWSQAGASGPPAACPLTAQVAELMQGDLAVVSIEAPKIVRAGDMASVVIRLQNRGTGQVGGGYLVLTANGKQVGRQRIQRRFLPGEQQDYLVKWKPEQEGSYSLLARTEGVLAPSGQVRPESSLEIAVNVEEPQLSDLMVTRVTVEGQPRQGVPLKVFVQVENQGQVPVYSVPVELRVGGEVVARRTQRGVLRPGNFWSVPLSWVPTRAGTQEVLAVANPGGRLREKALENNAGKVTVEVAGRAAPNLRAVRLEVPDLIVGKEARLDAVIRNDGDIAPVAARVVLLVDGRVVGEGKLADVTLRPGSETSVPFQWTPLAAGRVLVTAQVECTGVLTEVDLSDNRVELEAEVRAPHQKNF
ncbi:MAG TPA: CARDB domain-containing protein [Candidatus Nitrosotenuis sp.]|jgi:subtilase family serine protease|nr:CARDB domain-containing protein [Candidatus Nitrosotenuis sp.]